MNTFSKKNIDNIVFDILRKSKSLDIFPTPVDKIVEYCELNLNNNDGFHSGVNTYIAKNADAFNRMIKKVLGALDRERKIIYINPSLPNVKQNFIKLHEAGHSALPWQNEVKYFDDEYSLNPDVKEMFEAEANYFASAGLFQLDRFEDDMTNLPLEIGSPIALAKKFGGSNHASIRRYSELSKKRCALIVLENKDKNGDRFSLGFRNNFQSKSFLKEFGELSWPEKFDITYPFVQDYRRKRQFHKEGVINIETLNGIENFSYHYFFNGFNVFVLILPKGEEIKSRTKIYVTSEIPK